MRCAVIDIVTYIVVNMIVADASKDVPPEGYFFVDVSEVTCGIGWVYDPVTNTFSDPTFVEQAGGGA